MTLITPVDRDGECPACGTAMLLTLDTDGEREWVHEVWRACSCPMPAKLDEYHAVDITAISTGVTNASE